MPHTATHAPSVSVNYIQFFNTLIMPIIDHHACLFSAMVRTYKRKTDRAAYSSDNLKQCLTAVKNNIELSVRDASKQFGIPRATIQKRLKSGTFDPKENLVDTKEHLLTKWKLS